jgi:hypothetical protein
MGVEILINNWSIRQKKIHEGLSSFGQEIAGFYEGGLKIYYCNDFPNGAYFLMHAAREVDGGIRDILGVDFNPDKDEVEKHKKSILFSLGYAELEGLAEAWYKVSNKFHSYAHRHGPWKSSRLLSEVKPIWNEYEYILERLVGSYFSIIERIERIGKVENLKPSVVDSLSNILSIPTYYNYFFRHERSIKWFSPLKKKGWFSPKQIKYDDRGNALFWNALDYLECISEKVESISSLGKELIEIIDNLVTYSNKQKIRNIHIWLCCFKILNNLPTPIILDSLSAVKLLSWFSAATDDWGGNDLVIHDVGEKLLPKFLSDEFKPDYLHAEAVIDAITEIKADKKPYPFKDYNEVALLWDAHWVRDAFEKNAKSIGQRCSNNTILIIAGKLKKTIIYTRNKNSNISWINGIMYNFEVSRKPNESDKQGITFIENQYDCLISRYSAEQTKDIDVEKSYWSLSGTEPSEKINQFSFSASSKKKMISEIKKHLPKEAAPKKDDTLDEDLEAIFNGLYNDFSEIWFKSLANDKSTFGQKAEEALSINLRDVLLAKCESNREDGRKILDAFLSDEYIFPIFRRLVLFCTDKYWHDYKDYFDMFLDLVPDAFEGLEYEVELFDLMLNNNYDFNTSLIDKIKAMIDKVPDYYLNKDPRTKDYWQYKWLSPVKDNPAFKDHYDEISQKIKSGEIKPYEPERTSFPVSEWLGHKSSIPKEKILEISVEDFLKIYNEVPTQTGLGSIHKRSQENPDKVGLGNEFQAALKDNPKKYTDKIFLFLNADKYINQQLFSGLKDAWKLNKEIDWNNIFKYIPAYIDKNNSLILKEKDKEPEPLSGDIKFEWIIKVIADLIADGCQDDSHAFDTKHFDDVEEIFTKILSLIEGEKKPDIKRDSITYVFNSTLGRIVMAYVSFALRKARATKEKEENWGKNKYERFFEKGIDGFIWFGRNLPQICYLDQGYAEEKIKYFTSLTIDNFNWRMFMSGYLEGRQVYKDTYKLMRSNYLKVITNDVFDKNIGKWLVEHICIGYVYSDESLDSKNDDGEDSLFYLMLTKADELKKQYRWFETADFLKTLSNQPRGTEEKEYKEIKRRILEFWAWTYENREQVSSILREEYSNFLEIIAHFIDLLDKIDENSENWLLLSSPNIDINHKSYSFMKSLNKFDDEKSVRRIGRLFLEILEHTTPQYPLEDIQEIVRKIYKIGEKSTANDICNIYGSRSNGILLKEIWNENN